MIQGSIKGIVIGTASDRQFIFKVKMAKEKYLMQSKQNVNSYTDGVQETMLRVESTTK